MRTPFVVAIDGPAASGKSTVSRVLAGKFGLNWVSTGVFYRGVAFVAEQEGISSHEESRLLELIGSKNWQVKMTAEATLFFYKDRDVTSKILKDRVGGFASEIASLPRVREALVEPQRQCAHQGKGLIAEGRDCGTVIFPDSQLKIFLTAESSARAKRRAMQAQSQLETVENKQADRDARDSARKVAPMVAHSDALKMDTSNLSLDQVVDKISVHVTECLQAYMKNSQGSI